MKPTRIVPGETRCCLCVLFNHPYTANIPLLREVYADRFSHIRFIVPLEQSPDEDVLTVYRGSFAHQAYMVDHLDALEALDCTHYVFIHDDVLLSPWLDETNILQVLRLRTSHEGFISKMEPMPTDVGQWGYQAGSLWKLFHPRNTLSGTGVDSLEAVLKQLPPQEEAARRAARYGLPPTTRFTFTERSLSPEYTLSKFSFFGTADRQAEMAFVEQALTLLFGSPAPAEREIPYPLVCGGPASDFYVVPRPAMRQYAHVAGVLAAAGLFVEMVSATALMLSCDHVRSQVDCERTFIWGIEQIDPIVALDQMLGDETIFLRHPVKLSRIADPRGYARRMKVVRNRPPRLTERDDKRAVRRLAPGFDPAGYLEHNPDVADSGASAYTHYRRHGHGEGRRWA